MKAKLVLSCLMVSVITAKPMGSRWNEGGMHPYAAAPFHTEDLHNSPYPNIHHAEENVEQAMPARPMESRWNEIGMPSRTAASVDAKDFHNSPYSVPYPYAPHAEGNVEQVITARPMASLWNEGGMFHNSPYPNIYHAEENVEQAVTARPIESRWNELGMPSRAAASVHAKDFHNAPHSVPYPYVHHAEGNVEQVMTARPMASGWNEVGMHPYATASVHTGDVQHVPYSYVDHPAENVEQVMTARPMKSPWNEVKTHPYAEASVHDYHHVPYPYVHYAEGKVEQTGHHPEPKVHYLDTKEDAHVTDQANPTNPIVPVRTKKRDQLADQLKHIHKCFTKFAVREALRDFTHRKGGDVEHKGPSRHTIVIAGENEDESTQLDEAGLENVSNMLNTAVGELSNEETKSLFEGIASAIKSGVENSAAPVGEALKPVLEAAKGAFEDVDVGKIIGGVFQFLVDALLDAKD
ncbi:hypothetical protein DFH28DRAFT_926929 [Melampsora americana]|nr:hypothetical protein DFH28DRAFT_926929 [Melampsora americana]